MTVAGRLRDIASAHATALAAAVVLFGVAFASFTLNAFAVLPNEMVSEFEAQSDNLVYDALRLGKSGLGYVAGGAFIPYRSQAGGQLMLYRWLDLPAAAIPSFNSVMLAGTIVAIFVGLRRAIGTAGATAGALMLVLSPWIVLFSGSAYWAAWSLLLPFAITLLIGSWLFASPGRAAAALCALSFAFLFRFSSGYEFVTVVVVAALAPVVFWGLKSAFGWRGIAARLFIVGLSSLVAFGVALSIHAGQLADVGLDPYREIVTLATKRTHASDVESLSIAACRPPPPSMSEADCRRGYETSLQSSVPQVIAIYVTFRRALPWLASAGAIDAPELAPTRAALRDLDLPRALRLAAGVAGGVAGVGASLVTAALCWLAIVMAIRVSSARWPARKPEAALLAVAALAPLSWFVLAKGHAAAHTHLAFVLWSLPFLPLLAAILAQAAAHHFIRRTGTPPETQLWPRTGER